MFRSIQPKTRVVAPKIVQTPKTHSLGNMMGFILSPQVKTCRRCGEK
jgi:hypothetical protein